jgi:hypothetical protein
LGVDGLHKLLNEERAGKATGLVVLRGKNKFEFVVTPELRVS